MDSPGGGGGPAFTMGTKPVETAAREEVPGPAGPAFTFPAAKEHEPNSPTGGSSG
ncbi:hypothetical protein HaLaN_13095 [Haematococcus lacustris]|uniref:Uncharacterized protein n=1 Tax=Haematococcus lacustris TaxID=44745 RepID=A0A699Z255_HAELA|nr:hypothetical protein HaLaN_13095 [Haematococcus lacustris]